MRSTWSLVASHRRVAAAMGAVWIASWAAIYIAWDPAIGLEPWMVGLRFAFLLVVAALIGAAAARSGRDWDQLVRVARPVTLIVALLDVVAFMAPDTIATVFSGGPSDPWTAAIWFVLLLVGWAVASVIAALGALPGARLASLRAGAASAPQP
jgi:small-conductance mechanosensitive channel